MRIKITTECHSPYAMTAPQTWITLLWKALFAYKQYRDNGTIVKCIQKIIIRVYAKMMQNNSNNRKLYCLVNKKHQICKLDGTLKWTIKQTLHSNYNLDFCFIRSEFELSKELNWKYQGLYNPKWLSSLFLVSHRLTTVNKSIR